MVHTHLLSVFAVLVSHWSKKDINSRYDILIRTFQLMNFSDYPLILSLKGENFIYIFIYIGIMVRVVATGPGDLGSIPGRVIPKTQKMILDSSWLNTQHYKVCAKGKVEQSKERSSALFLHLGVVAIEKGAFRSPSTTVANFYLYILSSTDRLFCCIITFQCG